MPNSNNRLWQLEYTFSIVVIGLLIAEVTCCFVSDSDIPHVMISYHWGSQKTMLYVKDKLKAAGYKVWMDIDNMSKHWFTFF